MQDRLLKNVFNLTINAAQFILRPGFELSPKPGINAKQERFPLSHALA
jgi:hypothetical protein